MAARKCKCGGRFKSIDLVEEAGEVNGHMCYRTVRILKDTASWRCNKCGKLMRQRLRTPKKKYDDLTLVEMFREDMRKDRRSIEKMSPMNAQVHYIHWLENRLLALISRRSSLK